MKLSVLIPIVTLLYGCGEVSVAAKENFSGRQDGAGLVKSRRYPDAGYQVEYLKNYPGNTGAFYYFKFNVTSAAFEKNKDMLQYMNYQMQQDFVLRLQADSIPCVFYQPVPKGMGNKLEFLVAFELDDDQRPPAMEFIFNDHVIRNEPIVFSYTSKDFAKNDNKKAE